MSSAHTLANLERGALIAAAVSVSASVIAGYYLYKYQIQDLSSNAKSEGLRRAGAIRRSRRPAAADGVQPANNHGLDGAVPEEQYENNTFFIDEDQVEHLDLAANEEEADNQTEHSIPDEDADQVASSQHSQSKLKELTYYIAQNRELENGIVHRGITCDNCKTIPIRGVRYRCANCEDFDLCEHCEANCDHVRTHVFYKIRVPCFWGPGKAEPVWFPGLPNRIPDQLHREVLQQVLRSLAFLESRFIPDESQVKGWYLQFSCLADTRSSGTSYLERHGLTYGISRAAFRYLLPVATRGVLAFNRLFAMFDNDGDGLINFQEFVQGAILVGIRKSFPAWKYYMFQAFDLDGDGFIGRQDMLELYKSIHEIAEDIALCHLKLYNESDDQRHVDERRTLRDYVDTNRPLPNFFSYQHMDQLHLHRMDVPIFNQLSGRSNVPNDDVGGDLLFDTDTCPRRAVREPPRTAAADFIHNQLVAAFNELLDPIFKDHEQYLTILDQNLQTIKKHEALLQHSMVVVRTWIKHLPSVDMFPQCDILNLNAVGDSIEQENEALERAGRCSAKDAAQIDWPNLQLNILNDMYDISQQQQLSAELMAMAEQFASIPRWRDDVKFSEILNDQRNASWNPLFRHETLSVTPSLLALMIEELWYMLVWERGASEKSKQGKLNDKEFWERADDIDKFRDSGGSPLPFVDVMGLVVI